MEKVFLNHFIPIFQAAPNIDMRPILSKFKKVISNDQNSMLDCKFTKEEVKLALSQTSTDLAPGPVGFNFFLNAGTRWEMMFLSL